MLIISFEASQGRFACRPLRHVLSAAARGGCWLQVPAQPEVLFAVVAPGALDTNRAVCMPGLLQRSEVYFVIAGSEKCNIKTSPAVFKLSVRRMTLGYSSEAQRMLETSQGSEGNSDLLQDFQFMNLFQSLQKLLSANENLLDVCFGVDFGQE